MNGARVLTEYGTPQATVLYIVIVVRCGGKRDCWPSTRLLMADTGASERTINRWRGILKDAGLITVQRRRNQSALICLTKLSGFRLTLAKPEPDPSTTELSTRLSTSGAGTAKDGGAGTAKGGRTEESKRRLQEAPLEAKDRHRARGDAGGQRSGGRPPRQREREAAESVGRLVREMAKRRTGDHVYSAPSPCRRDEDRSKARALLKESQQRPSDWQALRAAPGWTEREERQMDYECEHFGEDHAYHRWLVRWLESRHAS